MRLRRPTHELAGAYALDALDGEERRRFERHLRRCPACEREVRGFARTAAVLAMATAAEPPLPSAKVYELWLLGPRSARPAGLLPNGGKTAPVLASGVAADDKVGVTVEPAGGTSSPTTTPIVVLALPA